MAIVIPPGFGQLVYRFSLVDDPEEMLTTIGVAIVGDPQTEVDTRRTQFIAGWPPANRSSSYTFRGCRLYTDNSGGSSAIFEAAANSPGTAALAPLPQNCALLVRKNTATAGRAHRGRMFLPAFGLPEGNVNANGTLVAQAATDMQALVSAAFLGDFFVILHDSTSPAGPTPTPVTTLVVDNRIATQRRRLR